MGVQMQVARKNRVHLQNLDRSGETEDLKTVWEMDIGKIDEDDWGKIRNRKVFKNMPSRIKENSYKTLWRQYLT